MNQPGSETRTGYGWAAREEGLDFRTPHVQMADIQIPEVNACDGGDSVTGRRDPFRVVNAVHTDLNTGGRKSTLTFTVYMSSLTAHLLPCRGLFRPILIKEAIRQQVHPDTYVVGHLLELPVIPS